MKQPVGTIQYKLYEDKVDYIGTAKVKLPDLKFLIQEVSGAGIAGKVESILLGQLEAMVLGIEFTSHSDKAIRLTEPRRHTLDLRVASETEDTVNGNLYVQSDKHVFVVIPKSLSGASIEPASQASASGEYAVRYWAAYKDGEKMIEIDPFAGICIINGVDYMADVNKALGK